MSCSANWKIIGNLSVKTNLKFISKTKDSTLNAKTCVNQISGTYKNESSNDTLFNKNNLAAETTTTILSSNSQFYEQQRQSLNYNDDIYIPPAPPLPNQPMHNSYETDLKNYDLTSSQSEIKDSSIVITKSFLVNSHADEHLDGKNSNSSHNDNSNNNEKEVPKFENEIMKKLKNLNVVKKKVEDSEQSHIDENDNVNELISISQIPSVMQTLDRQKCDTYTTQFKNPINDPRRMTSFRSDFSTNSIGSNISTRSMLSEAKAKLEALSGKMTSIKQTNYSNGSFNNGTNYLDLNKNNFECVNSNNLTSNNREIDTGYEGDQSDFIQTKF